MSERPDFLAQGERARLFPVLADTSKEGRTLSILLACLESVDGFGKSLLADLGLRIGARTKIETYTEVVMKKGGDKACRPDGLIVVRNGPKVWSAFVEAKVGAAELTAEQTEMYLELAKLNGVDALVTVSNQFTSLPSHHPLQLSSAAKKKAQLFHWSWMHVLTQATLQIGQDVVTDREQRIILNEMVRFLSHPSAGVKGFDQMPVAWTTIAQAIQAGGTISPKSDDALDVVGAWHQEVRDLSLVLSRQIGEDVGIRASRAHLADPVSRLKGDAQDLASNLCLRATLIVPNAAAPMEVIADFRQRSIFVSMRLYAPTDRQSTKARVNWLIRQLQKASSENIHIRLVWPGRGPYTQHSLEALRDNVDVALDGSKVVSSFEVVYAQDLGARFAQRKSFIIELEKAVPDFYERAGQHLRVWQAPAPKIKEDRADPSDVSKEALRAEAEKNAESRTEEVG